MTTYNTKQMLGILIGDTTKTFRTDISEKVGLDCGVIGGEIFCINKYNMTCGIPRNSMWAELENINLQEIVSANADTEVTKLKRVSGDKCKIGKCEKLKRSD